MNIYIYYFFSFSSIIGYYKILNIVPCAPCCLFYRHKCVSVNPKLILYPTHSPLVTTNLFSTSVSPFLFCKYVHLYHLFYSIYKWFHDTCLSPSDLFHLLSSSPSPPKLLQMALFHSFLWLSNIPLYLSVPLLPYPFICWWTFRESSRLQDYMWECVEMFVMVKAGVMLLAASRRSQGCS